MRFSSLTLRRSPPVPGSEQRRFGSRLIEEHRALLSSSLEGPVPYLSRSGLGLRPDQRRLLLGLSADVLRFLLGDEKSDRWPGHEWPLPLGGRRFRLLRFTHPGRLGAEQVGPQRLEIGCLLVRALLGCRLTRASSCQPLRLLRGLTALPLVRLAPGGAGRRAFRGGRSVGGGERAPGPGRSPEGAARCTGTGLGVGAAAGAGRGDPPRKEPVAEASWSRPPQALQPAWVPRLGAVATPRPERRPGPAWTPTPGAAEPPLKLPPVLALSRAPSSTPRQRVRLPPRKRDRRRRGGARAEPGRFRKPRRPRPGGLSPRWSAQHGPGGTVRLR